MNDRNVYNTNIWRFSHCKRKLKTKFPSFLFLSCLYAVCVEFMYIKWCAHVIYIHVISTSNIIIKCSIIMCHSRLLLQCTFLLLLSSLSLRVCSRMLIRMNSDEKIAHFTFTLQLINVKSALSSFRCN